MYSLIFPWQPVLQGHSRKKTTDPEKKKNKNTFSRLYRVSTFLLKKKNSMHDLLLSLGLGLFIKFNYKQNYCVDCLK